MSGSDCVATEFICCFKQFAPFYRRVAYHTGIGCTAVQVFVDKVVYDRFLEFLTNIEYVMFESQIVGHSFGFKKGVDTATSFFFFHTSPRNRIEGTIGNTYQLISLFLQQHGGNSTVDASAHGH